MKLSAVRRSELTIIGFALFLLALPLSGSVSLAADEGTDITPDEIVVELQTKPDLNEHQAKDLTSALTGLAKTLDALIAKQEGTKEEEDPKAFIDGV